MPKKAPAQQPLEKIRLEYVPLPQAVAWEWKRNPKMHDLGDIAGSIAKNGFADPPKYDSSLDGLVYGNGRVEALAQMKNQGRSVPRGIAIDSDTGEWLVPVVFGLDAKSKAAAEAFAVDHNNLTMSGGDFTAYDMSKMWTKDYATLLTDLQAQAQEMLTVDPHSIEALQRTFADDSKLAQTVESGGDAGWDSVFEPRDVETDIAKAKAKEDAAKLTEQITCPSCGHIFTPSS